MSQKNYGRPHAKKNKYMKKTSAKETYLVNITAVFILFFVFFLVRDFTFSQNRNANIPDENVAAFQIPQKTMLDLDLLSEKYTINFAELLAVYSLENNFFPTETTAPTSDELEQNFIRNYDNIKEQYSDSTIQTYTELFENILNEIEYFPIPENYDEYGPQSYMYGDSWRDEKIFDFGENYYQGTDIYDRENSPGRIPIVSMTDGTVESAGWSDENGYMVKIEAPEGGLYYYSHLDSFTDGVIKDASVEAGQVLGYMGNTGSLEDEIRDNTLQTYLHLGIQPNTSIGNDEMFINPYPFLSVIEDTKVSIDEQYKSYEYDVLDETY